MGTIQTRTQNMTHQEITNNLRAALKEAGVACNVRKQLICGSRFIQVNVKRYGDEFSSADQRTTRRIAVDMGLTHVRGMEIDVDQDTDPFSHNFVADRALAA